VKNNTTMSVARGTDGMTQARRKARRDTTTATIHDQRISRNTRIEILLSNSSAKKWLRITPNQADPTITDQVRRAART
jgi:hypothetical protein